MQSLTSKKKLFLVTEKKIHLHSVALKKNIFLLKIKVIYDDAMTIIMLLIS